MNNRYEIKTAVKEGPCDLCFRSTNSVLTNGTADFFFICKPHLLEPLFCKPERAPSPPAPSTAVPSILTEEKKEEASKEEGSKEDTVETPELPPPRWYILDPKIYGEIHRF
jgi:hypothetical protein